MEYHQWQIYWGFRNGDCDISVELLPLDTNDKKVNHIKGFYSDSLLHLACQNGWLDYVKLLVEQLGFNPEIKDCGNQTPVHYACHYGHFNVLQYLREVQDCDVAVATSDLWTPLHYACRYGHPNIIEYMLNIPEVMNRRQLQHVVCKYLHNGNFENLIEKQGSQAVLELLYTLLQIACILIKVKLFNSCVANIVVIST